VPGLKFNHSVNGCGHNASNTLGVAYSRMTTVNVVVLDTKKRNTPFKDNIPGRTRSMSFSKDTHNCQKDVYRHLEKKEAIVTKQRVID